MKSLVLIFLFLFASTVGASAHTFHTSLTRMDYNADEKSVEITIQVFAHDLETALERKAGKRLNLEKTPEIGKIILAYLSERFVLKNKNGETKNLQWVGKEQSADAVWLYVETEMPEGLSGAKLENTIFFDLHNDQVNLLTCRFEGEKRDLVFKPNAKAQELFSIEGK